MAPKTKKKEAPASKAKASSPTKIKSSGLSTAATRPTIPTKKSHLPLSPATDSDLQRAFRLDIIFELIKDGTPTKKACGAAGTTYRSLLNWINLDPSLLARYEDCKADLHSQVAEVAKLCALRALDDSKYQTSMIFYLKCRAGWNDGSGFNTGSVMPSITYSNSSTDRGDKATEDSSDSDS